MGITLGISPCPNDTFMFYHLLKANLFDSDLTIADVEALNQKALHHELDISKVSFYAIIPCSMRVPLWETSAVPFW
jgi:1,4-dihydroxy-6-naphthoate synthase